MAGGSVGHTCGVNDADWCDAWIMQQRCLLSVAQLVVNVKGDERVVIAEASKRGKRTAKLLRVRYARIREPMSNAAYKS